MLRSQKTQTHTTVCRSDLKGYTYQIRMVQLFPLIHQHHALGVDQSEAVNPPQADMEAGLDICCLVHRSRVTEGVRLVQGTWWWRLKRYQMLEVVDVWQRLCRRLRINLMQKQEWCKKVF